MQHAMFRWIEAADERSALDQPTVVIVPRKSGAAVLGRLTNLATLLGIIFAAFSR